MLHVESEQVSDLERHKHSGLKGPLAMTSGNPRHERPLWIWDLETGVFIWANSEGIKFWAAETLDRLQRTRFDKTHPAFVAVSDAMTDEMPASGVDIDLEFSHDNSDGRYSALCRPGTLQDRRAIIVELKGAAKSEASHPRRRARAELEDPHGEGADGAENAASLAHPDEYGEQADAFEDGKDEQSNEPSPLVPPIKMVPPPRNDEPGERAEARQVAAKAMAHVERRVMRAEPPVNPVLSERTEDRLHELARLIKEAAGQPRGAKPQAERQRPHQANSAKDSSPNDNSSRDRSDGEVAHGHDGGRDPAVAIGGGPGPQVTAQAAAFFEAVDVDMPALLGAGDMADIERVLNASDVPLALISFQKIIHANDGFVSAFGYGEAEGLVSDGTDWLLPQGRAALRAALEDGAPGYNQLETIRLRSGRRLSRDVYLRSVRLVKFDRVLLVIGLDDGAAPQRAHDESWGDKSSGEESGGDEALIEDVTSIPLLGAISHEVRTPLNVIIGFSEIMAREEFGPLGQEGSKGAEKYHGYVEDIHNSARHALSLINDLLDLTKLRAGKWEVDAAPVDLNEIVLEQTRMMRGLAGQQNVKLRATLEENLPPLLLDRRAVGQILINLISNAIKFSDEAGVVCVETERLSPEHVVLTVSDTGRGMTEAEVEQAMKPFRQIDASEVTLGTGLGLPIAKALAEANGMDFIIKSEKAVGTTAVMAINVSD